MIAKAGVVDIFSAWALATTHDFNIGMAPDVVFLFDMGQLADADNLDWRACLGWFGAGGSFCQSSYGQHGVTPSNCTGTVKADRCHVVGNGGTGTAGRLTGSLLPDGFQLAVAEVYTADRKLGYLAIEGCDVAMGSGSTGSTSADLVVTGLGFTPTAVLFVGGATSVAVGTITGSNGQGSIGFLVGSSAAGIGHGMQDASANENVGSTHSETHALFGSSTNPGGAMSAAHLPGQLDADGFTLTHPTGTSVIGYAYVALGGIEAALLKGATLTAPGTLGTGALGFSPKACIGISTMNATAAETTASADAQRAVGVAASDGSMVSAFYLAVDGLNPMDHLTRSTTTRFLQHYNRTGLNTYALAGDLDVASFGADEVTFEQLDGDDAAHRFAVLVLGDPPAGGPTYHDFSVTIGAELEDGVGGGGGGATQLVDGGLVS